ncbi:MAG TPA: hypothetical protein VFV43_08800 [Limnobacter sp.]|nr:hypothetical protein [Limnobacter sp.]
MQVAASTDHAVQQLFAPKPLPKPLSDPLYTLRPYVAFLIAIQLVVAAGFFVFGVVLGQLESLIQAGIGLIAPAFLLVVYALALPRQATNVFYLRSFKKDASSHKVREMLEVALGGDFRLSGIRDPKKRVPHFLKPIVLVPMMLAYAGSKYLNLEAQEDWKARLWRSLADARGVVLDVRELTEFVIEEIELVLACMSPERILFVVQNTDELGVLKARLATKHIAIAVNSPVLVWDESSPHNTQQFMQGCKAFAAQLPKQSAGLAVRAAHLVATHVKTQGLLVRERLNALIQYTLGTAMLLALAFVPGRTGLLADWPALGVALAVLLVLQVVLLLKHCVGVACKLRLAKQHNPLYQSRLRAGLAYGLGFGVLLFSAGSAIMLMGVRQTYFAYEDRASQHAFVANYRALEMIKADVFFEGGSAIVDTRSLYESLPPALAVGYALNGNQLDMVGTGGSVWVATPQTAQAEAVLGASWQGLNIAPGCTATTMAQLQNSEVIYQWCAAHANATP